MKFKNEYLINMYFLLLIGFIFTNFIYGIQSPIIILLTIFISFITIGFQKSIKLKIRDLIFIIFSLFMLIASIYSPRSIEAFKFAISSICLILSMIMISKEKKIDYNKILKYILFFSGIHVLSTIIYQIFPSQMQKVLPFFLQGKDLIRNIYEFNNNHINCGITPIQNTNAIYISSFLSIIYARIIYGKNKKILNMCLLILGIVALLLTSKRGLLIGNLVAMFFILFYNQYKNKKITFTSIIKISLIISIIVVLGLFIITSYFPDALRIFDRFTKGDITNGRNTIYKIIFEEYKKGNLLLGNGLFSSRDILYTYMGSSNDAHNIYLQVLSELGIFGIALFGATIIKIFMCILKLKLNKNNNIQILSNVYFIIVFFMYGITGNALFDLTISTLYYLMIGLLFNIYEKNKEEEYENRDTDIS